MHVKHSQLKQTTVACEKLDPLFFLNNTLHVHRRTRKPTAGSFTVWDEAWSFWNTYLQSNLGKTRVLFFRRELYIHINIFDLECSEKFSIHFDEHIIHFIFMLAFTIYGGCQ